MKIQDRVSLTLLLELNFKCKPDLILLPASTTIEMPPRFSS